MEGLSRRYSAYLKMQECEREWCAANLGTPREARAFVAYREARANYYDLCPEVTTEEFKAERMVGVSKEDADANR